MLKNSDRQRVFAHSLLCRRKVALNATENVITRCNIVGFFTLYKRALVASARQTNWNNS